MSLIKYKVRDIAKDLGKQPKEISAIMAKCTAAPKSNMQVMEDIELAFVFEYLTQTNQVDSIESIYADVYHEAKPAAEAPEAPAEAEAPEAPEEAAAAEAPEEPEAPEAPAEPARKKGFFARLFGR